MTTSLTAAPGARPALRSGTPARLPNLPWPQDIPEHRKLQGRDRWTDWALASITQPNGFDPRTGKQLYRTTTVTHAPFPEYKAMVRLPKETSFRDVISMARAVSMEGDPHRTWGNAQAVMQSESGSWYITMAGEPEGDDHIEPLPVGWHTDAVVRQRQHDVAALVDDDHWVNFTDLTP